MKAKRENNIQYYHSLTEDFVVSSRQNISLPACYRWIHKSVWYRMTAQLLYGIACVFALFYTRVVLHVKIVNRKSLKEFRRGGIFLYVYQTQPSAYALAPARYVFPKRIYTVAAASNLGISVIGKLLPMLGALIAPGRLSQTKEFLTAVKYHASHGRCIVIYPEAHVWPYCTFVRPFPTTSFRFPVMCDAPSFCMTTTYQRRNHRKKPRITVYIDGPFYPDKNMSQKNAQKRLHDEIYECMKERCKSNTYEYIRYVKESVS